MIVREIVLQEVVLKRQELAGDAFDAEREARYAAYTQNFRYATVFVSIIPMLIIYPFVQTLPGTRSDDRITQGMTAPRPLMKRPALC